MIEPPVDLTLPLPDSTTARRVLSRAVGRLLGDLGDVLRRAVGPATLRADIAALVRIIGALPDRSAALSSVLRRANVAALVRCARAQDPIAPALVAELVATLALELEVLGAIPAFRSATAPTRVVSQVGRFVTTDGRPRARDDALFPLVEGEIVLALADNNPLAMFDAHPGKSGNRIDLGGRSVTEWCTSLRDALARIERYLPDLRRELDLFVQQFVPVGVDADAHLSASYREAIGTIYLTLHPQAMTMTEAVIHEFSHNKLNALFEIDDVLINAYAPLFQSPVRPDPRPLHGILLAVHAFVPVARLYERMIDERDPLAESPRFRARFAQIVAGNREGMDVLRAHAEPTAAGRALLDELDRWDRHFVATRSTASAG